MGSNEMYSNNSLHDHKKTIKTVIKSTLVGWTFVIISIYLAKVIDFSRVFMVTFLINTIILVIFERYIYTKIKSRLKGTYTKQVIVIGSPKMYKLLSDNLSKTNMKYEIKGYVSVSNYEPLSKHIILGKLENLENIIKNFTIDEVIFALPKSYVGEVEDYIVMCETMGITVRMIVDLYDLKLSKTHITNIGSMPFITFHTVSLDVFQLMIKRIIDIIGALVGLSITLFIGSIVAVLIKLDSKGPVLFSQKRVGLNGRIFNCYKFRSMYVGAEAKKKELMRENEMKNNLMFKMKNDPRITKIGSFIRKTSIDELPQFWNVLKGEMSLVGTRPPTIDEVRSYKAGHRRRISIKPGITGLWQVNGRSSITDFEEVVRLDTNYIDNWSLTMDIKIILRTVLVVFKGNETAY
jgi:exopolysaccharide biosynthesis polyprenyl glycosylphosphotransferase